VAVAVAAALAPLATASTPDPARELVRVDILGSSIASRFPATRSISFRYPSNWHVTRRRLDVVIDPRTVFAVASYPILESARDDCDGTHGRRRPSDGAFVLVKELVDGASLRTSLPRLPSRPRHFRTPTSGQAGCLAPPSILYEFRVARRAFYVWISVGPKATARTRAAAAAVLDGMWIARYPRA
jgi:hypothetical protein